MDFDRSERNLDRPATVEDKLVLTVLFLTLGGYFFIFTCLVFAGDGNFWWRISAQISIEICWPFWSLGLLFVWWRPPLLQRFYFSAERRMTRLARILVWIAFVLSVFAAVLVGVLLQFRILPIRPN